MSRVGVAADITGRVLSHEIVGVRSVYDRHAYVTEKGDAFESLARIAERIHNVVSLSTVKSAANRY
jgi:hypothetical protein